MKHILIFIVWFWSSMLMAQIPEGFVYVKDVIPDMEVELRYYTHNNFVGKPIIGYNSNVLILTASAAKALKVIHEALQDQNLCLKVYDGYRPQRSVNHFVIWARALNDTINKKLFYPDVNKRNLFKAGYIASKSGHSRGSTVDLTIVDGNTSVPLDMGSPYDFFGKASWVDFNHITDQQKSNRQLLQNVMIKHGFRNYPKEWWHFTFRAEPFTDTYFDFVIE